MANTHVMKMKTNQLMTVDVAGHTVRALHLTQQVSLTDLFFAGNLLRTQKTKMPANMGSFMNRAATGDYITAAAKAWGMNPEDMKTVIGRGNTAQTYVHISVAVYAAEWLDVDFHAHVIKCFIEDRILIERDNGGYLNHVVKSAIDTLPDRTGKDNSGMCIALNKKIKDKINPTGGGWNTATADELRTRSKLEDDITMLIMKKYVQDKEALWEAIEKF